MKAKVTYLYYLVQTGFLSLQPVVRETSHNWSQLLMQLYATSCMRLQLQLRGFVEFFRPVVVQLRQKRQKNRTRPDFKTLVVVAWWWWLCHQHRQWGEVVVWSHGHVDNRGGRQVVVVASSMQAVGWSSLLMEVLG